MTNNFAGNIYFPGQCIIFSFEWLSWVIVFIFSGHKLPSYLSFIRFSLLLESNLVFPKSFLLENQ